LVIEMSGKTLFVRTSFIAPPFSSIDVSTI